MKPDEIKASLESIKRHIDKAFDKGQIDFDRLNSLITSVINEIGEPRQPADGPALDCNLYR